MFRPLRKLSERARTRRISLMQNDNEGPRTAEGQAGGWPIRSDGCQQARDGEQDPVGKLLVCWISLP